MWHDEAAHDPRDAATSAEIVVPDNLKSGVKRPTHYARELNPTYANLARLYGAAVIPARPYRPRNKAKVEQRVLLAERWWSLRRTTGAWARSMS